MNLGLFCVWEDARVWVHWSHSFEMHLNYLGPVSCFSPSWVPSGCTVWGGFSGWLMASWPQHPLFTDMAGDILHPYHPALTFPDSVPTFVDSGPSVLPFIHSFSKYTVEHLLCARLSFRLWRYSDEHRQFPSSCDTIFWWRKLLITR